jgi:hypothetical protein
LAATLITFIPGNNGIGAVCHCAVPAATPERPVDVDQVTEATPVLSLANPFNTIVELDVE